MNKTRLEAFSDGVLAIILTIMVLEIKVPAGADFDTLQKVLPVFGSYILSFIYIGIYWTNHHHMLQSMNKVNGKILWANLHLLFWLSLVPVAKGWIGENHFAKVPMALYGFILLMAGTAYYILQNIIVKSQGENSLLKKAIGKDFKGNASPILYIIGIAFSFYNEWIAGGVYIFVALMWLVPDKRIERVIE
ncbi:TMEM175 family protein [Flavobacterium sp.]|uniref:TMEM175 family protein n=1 Tax=Flavobacterium sp. TaxID=239 RepID=UPI00286BE656|nr:TMEM175 family protein [Flavobacterium sp.]